MSEATPSPENLFFDLWARTKLHLSGSDRVRFLNGQITNDAAKATPKTAIAACVLNAKGKLEGQILVGADENGFLIDTDPDAKVKLQTRLERYAIADDIQFRDVSADFSIFHVLAPERPALPSFCRILESNRLRENGWDVWVEMAKRDEVFNRLAEHFFFCDDACMEIFRVERGIPRWNRELTEEIIPVEADLAESSIDYEKGCYIGQEVISRMKTSGQRNKKLCGFVSLYDVPLEAGMKIFAVGESAKDSGWITSAIHSKRLGKEIALGYMKRPFFHAGFRLDAKNLEQPEGAAVRVEVAELPFIGVAPPKPVVRDKE
jgi:folate-binding protein YgfZ